MPGTLRQSSFTGGEVAPALRGRSDLDRYYTSLSRCLNFIVMKEGGVTTRPGFKFVKESGVRGKRSRLIPFEFNTFQTYILEFTDGLIRVFSMGAPVLDPDTGDQVTVASPYTEADLPNIRYTQSGDIMFLVDGAHAIQELRRTAHDEWAIIASTFTPGIAAPEDVTYVSGGDNVSDDEKEWDWVVTAIDPVTGEESVGSTPLHVDDKQPSANPPAKIQWSHHAVATSFNVYRGQNQVYGFVGKTNTNSFIDRGQEPAYNETPPTGTNPFATAGNYPRIVLFSGQRLVFASTDNDPDRVWMSQSANYRNFGASSPARSDDTVIFTPATRKIDRISAIVPLGAMIVMTPSAEMSVTGSDGGVITPVSPDIRTHGYNGCADIDPLLIDRVAMYLTPRGQQVRDLVFDFAAQSFDSSETQVMSSHLFRKHRIVDWCWAAAPFGVVYLTREDGVLLGVTYQREHQVTGWHQHDTDGFFESVASVPEGDEDAVYAVVRRTVGGEQVRFIERMASRLPATQRDYVGLDCSLTFDGRADGVRPMVLKNGVTWAAGELMDIETGTDFFLPQYVGGMMVMFDSAGLPVRLTIESVTSTISAVVRPIRDVPPELQNLSTLNWELAFKTLHGFDHLEGRTIGVCLDGQVHKDVVVTGGKVELEDAGTVIHGGLRYLPEIETLELSSNQGSIRAKKRIIGELSIEVEESAEFLAGSDRAHLRPAPLKRVSASYELAPLVTDTIVLAGTGRWHRSGRVVIQQPNPLPLTVLGIEPEIEVGG